jgi:hypothetical protein
MMFNSRYQGASDLLCAPHILPAKDRWNVVLLKDGNTLKHFVEWGPTVCVGVKGPFILAILFFKQADSLLETKI